jgi:predicted DNA-binding protein (MmcQ/YjbR family)
MSHMNFESLRKYCATLPGTTRDIKWGADECYSVGGKMYAVFGIERGKPANVGFKCEPERFLELTDQQGIIPAPYLARAHWVLVQDGKALADAVARELVARSHGLIFAKLTRKAQSAIAAAAPASRRER